MTDIERIQQLSDQLGRHIPAIDPPEPNKSFYGYVLNDAGRITALGLPRCEISDYTFLASLTQLHTLDLRYNQISELTVLKALTGLVLVDLTYNNIKRLPAFIVDLKPHIVNGKWLFGWDELELWTFVVAAVGAFVAAFCALLFFNRAYLSDAFADKERQEIERVYAEQGYSPTEHARLERERAQIEANIRAK